MPMWRPFSFHEDLVLSVKTAWEDNGILSKVSVALNLRIDLTEVPATEEEDEDEDASNAVTETDECVVGNAHAIPTTTLPAVGGGESTMRKEWNQHCNVIVLDNFFCEAQRLEIYDLLTLPRPESSPSATLPSNAPASSASSSSSSSSPHPSPIALSANAFNRQNTDRVPPPSKWEKLTNDGPLTSLTFGLQSDVLSTIQHTVAMQEILCQLTLLYPEYAIGYQPNSNNFSAPSFSSATSPSSSSLESSSAYSYVCDQFVANAPCAGDTFSWHHDCDPCSFHPQCPWVKTHGEYVNHEVGKPLFVTMLLYLDRWWPLHFDAETLFLDPDSDCGVFVRPKAYRIVLMDQDIMHRLSPPSIHAQRPRYSVAVKLVFMSKGAQQKRLTLEKEEFGVPTMFGSTNPSFRGLLSLPKTSVSQVALARTDRKRSRTSALSDA